MARKPKPIPEGRNSAIPYLCIKDAARAIDFYKQAFGATELFRLAEPNGKVGHAELQIGSAVIMLADEHPEMGFFSPQTIGGTPVLLHLYVEDVDALAKRAEAAGITVTRPIEDQFYGDRGGKFTDPFGHIWWLATHKEDVSPAEMKKRAAALYGG
jgi:PhnB protein